MDWIIKTVGGLGKTALDYTIPTWKEILRVPEGQIREGPTEGKWNMLTRLEAGETIWPRDYIYSSNLRYRLIFQTDGNLVLYERGKGALWAAASNTPNPVCLRLDRNILNLLSLDSVPPDSVQWQSDGAQDGDGDAVLVVEDDGTAVIRDESSKRIIWTTANAPNKAILGSRPLESSFDVLWS